MMRTLLTWEERSKLVEELHALVATLRLGATALLKEPWHQVRQADRPPRWEAPEGFGRFKAILNTITEGQV